ncbi:MAG: hypothetical protein IPI73_13900 [Betaproteobacteria bacterium]|nr:hypothetical protein [Betaproteobacteria bacterium]
MEAIGTLAGGIAHDFNNLLQIILGNTELARMDAGANWQALVSLEEIQKAGHRARDLVQQILSFSRRQPTWRRVMSLPAVVEESTRLLRAALPAGLRIECRCAADTPSIVADPTQVEQVLLNLGTNAAYAMEGKVGNYRNHRRGRHTGRLRRGAESQAAAGQLRARRGQRFRARDGRRDPAADLRTVLHHQAGGQGHRTGPVGGAWHHAHARRSDRRAQRAGQGQPLRVVLSACPGWRRR